MSERQFDPYNLCKSKWKDNVTEMDDTISIRVLGLVIFPVLVDMRRY